MGKRRKIYTPEFKLEAVRLATEPGRVASHVAEELGIASGVLSRWIQRYEEFGETAFLKPSERVTSGCEEVTAAEKIRKLEREVAELREEREILKKAAAYFAKHQS